MSALGATISDIDYSFKGSEGRGNHRVALNLQSGWCNWKKSSALEDAHSARIVHKMFSVKVGVISDSLARIKTVVLGAIDRNGSIDLAGYRDLTQTSRKYAQAMLELLDQRRVTRRVGDRRIRYRSAGNRAQGDDA